VKSSGEGVIQGSRAKSLGKGDIQKSCLKSLGEGVCIGFFEGVQEGSFEVVQGRRTKSIRTVIWGVIRGRG